MGKWSIVSLSCFKPFSGLLLGRAKKGTERWGKEKTCNPTTQKALPGPGTLQIPPFYPKSSSLHSSPCKLLLTHQVPASMSHLQKHFLILHLDSTTTNISSSHILWFFLFQRTWTICNDGSISMCSLHMHPHLDGSSVNVLPCSLLSCPLRLGTGPEDTPGHLCSSLHTWTEGPSSLSLSFYQHAALPSCSWSNSAFFL